MLRKILPHAAILLGNMYIVFYLIDRVNSAMSFIDNAITKGLLVLLCLISTFNAALLIRDERRRVRREQELAARRRAARAAAPAARPASSVSGRPSRFGSYR